MKNLDFKIIINASASNVWLTLWNDSTYRKWTEVFHSGSYAVSDWNEGSSIHFLTPEGNGMFSVIDKLVPLEHMSFKHIGELKNFKEQPIIEETKKWSGSVESYTLNESNGTTTLYCKMDVYEQFMDFFTHSFPKGMAKVKELAEAAEKSTIRIETTVGANINKVWDTWTIPSHIVNWNFASDDWFAPAAKNDLHIGGKFSFSMAAKDKSASFDFEGEYLQVKNHEYIEYKIIDGRNVKIMFINQGKTVRVIETFEPENIHSLDLQRTGWQSILDNFKKYVEI